MPGDDLGACIEAVVDVMGNYIREPLIIPRGDTRPDFDMSLYSRSRLSRSPRFKRCGSARTGSSLRSENHDGTFPGELVERCVELVVVNENAQGRVPRRADPVPEVRIGAATAGGCEFLGFVVPCGQIS